MRPPPRWSGSPWLRRSASSSLTGPGAGKLIVRKEAETNFNMALKAVEDYLTSVSENTLLKQQDSVDIRSLRQELLNTALKYYKSFVSQRSDDPQAPPATGERLLPRGRDHPGDRLSCPGDRGVSLGADHLGIARRGRPRESSVSGPCWPIAILAIGKQKGALGDFQGAMTSFEQARAILEPLAARHLDLALYQPRLADCYSEIGDHPGQASVRR